MGDRCAGIWKLLWTVREVLTPLTLAQRLAMLANGSEDLKHGSSEKIAVDAVDSTDSEVDKELASEAGHTLRRTMKNRHISMIRCVPSGTVASPAHTPSCSIGGVIGTGLFLGTANSLAAGGPVGLLLGYVIVGTICYSVYAFASLRNLTALCH